MKQLKNLLSSLVSISAPSGYEQSIISYLKSKIVVYSNLNIEEDVLGNLIVTKEGKRNKTIMLVAHCDEIGFAVKYIDEQGFIRYTPIGGVDISLIRGKSVSITHNDTVIQGVVGAMPIHLSHQDKNAKGTDAKDSWIDIGAKCKEEALTLVSVGDPITFSAYYAELNNHLASTKSVDNRVGVAILLSVIQEINELDTENRLVFVFSVQEEIGLRGVIAAGYTVCPDISIVIDVTHATDYPTIDQNTCGDIRVGEGPVIPIGANFNMHLQNILKSIAEKKRIPYQIESIPNCSGTDASELQLLRGGCLSSSLSIPCRYMHTPVETFSYMDVKYAIDILVDFILHGSIIPSGGCKKINNDRQCQPYLEC